MEPIARDPRPAYALWSALRLRDIERKPKAALQALVARVAADTAVGLYDAVEEGVPADAVLLLAAAFGLAPAAAMELVGVPETTFRRKHDAGEPLPEVAGHRVMALLRLMATLKGMLGDGAAGFDLEGWVGEWIAAPLPELANRRPADLLRNPEGQRALDGVLERLRGGLPA